jgi:hypothetical protein
MLHRVLGTVDVAQDPVRDREQPIRRATGDGGERLLVPEPSRLDEGSVHALSLAMRSPAGCCPY